MRSSFPDEPAGAEAKLSLVLHPARQIHVSVVDASDKPVANSWAAAVAGGRKIAEAMTDTAGNAVLHVPMEASLQCVLANKPAIGLDYLLYRREGELASDPYKLPFDHSERLRLQLDGTRNITVRVLNSLQQPMAGVTVCPSNFKKPKKGGNLNVAGLQEFNRVTDSGGVTRFSVPVHNTSNVTFSARAEGYFAPGRPTWDPNSSENEVIANLVSMVKVHGSASFPDGQATLVIQFHQKAANTLVKCFAPLHVISTTPKSNFSWSHCRNQNDSC